MTIDEAKEYISSIVDTYEICHDAKHTSVAVSIDAEDAKALNMAIASIEAWGKIKQEIEGLKVVYDKPSVEADIRADAEKCSVLCEMYKQIFLSIIDKHIKEVQHDG